MKTYRLAFVCILTVLIAVEPFFSINVMAKESSDSETLNIGD